MRFILLVLFITLSSYEARCQSEIKFLFDKTSSSIASSENLLSFHQILYQYENKHIASKYSLEDNFKKKSLGIMFRLTKTALIDFQLDFLVNLMQHEIFGHGSRYREFDLKRNSYHLSPFLPFGKGRGFARRGSASYDRLFGMSERISFHTGGMEASAVLANNLSKTWMKRGTINYRETLVYLMGLHDATQYIFKNSLNDNREAGDDIIGYLELVNARHGYFSEENYRLTLDDLSAQVSINLLNTHSVLAMYAFIKEYVFEGNETFGYPMIRFGQISWLPSLRFGLTPFGPEYIIENTLKKDVSILHVSNRFSLGNFESFWGVGLSYINGFDEKLDITFTGDLWHQPSLELGGKSRRDTKKGLGGRIFAELNYSPYQKIPLGLVAQVGYKTDGFIEGERLGSGLIFRIGFSILPATKSTIKGTN